MAELTTHSIVTFSPHTRFYRLDDEYILSTLRADYRFINQSAEVFEKIKFLLDGSISLGKIAEITGIPLDKLISTLDILIGEDDAVRDVTDLMAADNAESFLPLYFQLCDKWAADIFICPFWEAMMSGNAPQSVVLGWGMEFYHRVLGADEHNALSVNFCRDKVLLEWLAEHFAEEVDHGYIFLDGLVASGLEREKVLSSMPLPTTRALINYLNVLATTDLVSYLGCYGVMHSPRAGQTRERIDGQFKYLKSVYASAYPLLDKIHEHAAIDIDLGHDGIVFERFIREREKIDRITVIKCLGAIKGIVTAFVNFFGGIYEYYNSPDAQLPRQASL